jgi:hypothetical protein
MYIGLRWFHQWTTSSNLQTEVRNSVLPVLCIHFFHTSVLCIQFAITGNILDCAAEMTCFIFEKRWLVCYYCQFAMTFSVLRGDGLFFIYWECTLSSDFGCSLPFWLTDGLHNYFFREHNPKLHLGSINYSEVRCLWMKFAEGSSGS